MFSVVWLIVGILLGVAGTLSIRLLYNWMRRTSNRIESLKNQLHYYQQVEQDWIEFQFTKKKKD